MYQPPSLPLPPPTLTLPTDNDVTLQPLTSQNHNDEDAFFDDGLEEQNGAQKASLPTDLAPAASLLGPQEGEQGSPFEEDAGNDLRNLIHEKISPDELTGEKRDDYIADVWALFSAKASKGTINLDAADEIARTINIEGNLEEMYDKFPPEKELHFDELIEYYDQLSREANTGFRDLDVAHSSEDVIQVSPFGYAWLVLSCSKNPEAKYKVNWSFELKPKASLLLTTTALMLLVGLVLLTLIGVLWSTNSRGAEMDQLRAVRDAVEQLADLYEVTFLHEHEMELMDQTAVMGDYVDVLHSYEGGAELRHQKYLVHVIEAASYTAKVSQEKIDYEVFTQLLNHNAKFDGELLRAHFAESSNNVFVSSVAVNLTSYPMFDIITHAALNEEGTEFINRVGHHQCQPVTSGAPGTDSSWQFIPIVSATSNNASLCRHIVTTEEAHAEALVRYERAVAAFNQISVSNSTLGLWEILPTVQADGSIAMMGVPANDVLRAQCYDKNSNNLCDLLSKELTHLAVGEANSEIEIAYNNETGMHTELRLPDNLVLILNLPSRSYRIRAQDKMIDLVNYLNWQFVRSTEIVISREDPITGVLIPQATDFRFSELCYGGKCARFDGSMVNIKYAYEFQSSHHQYTPDYRPEPVIGASQWLPRLQVVLTLERDVQEVRGSAFASFIKLIDGVNSQLSANEEIELFYKDGLPAFMRTFNPYEPCPETTTCKELPYPTSIYYRYDCRHCQRMEPLPSNASLIFVTIPKKGARNATDIVLHPVYRKTLDEQQNFEATYQDYAGDIVFSQTSFMRNFSIGIAIKSDEVVIKGKTMSNIMMVCGVSIGFIALGLAVLLTLSGTALNTIEKDWADSKAKIEADRARFAQLVSDLVPPALAEKMMQGVMLISESSNCACVMVADICGFSEFTRSLPPRHIIRLVGYCFLCFETVAADCDVHVLSTIGDAVIVHCSQSARDQTKNDVDSKDKHPAMRGAKFGSVLTMLFSPQYEHYPEKIRHFRESFKERARSVISFNVPRLRVGGHVGAMVSGVLDTGRAPRFDCFGLTPSLAARMSATASPFSTHVTSMMKEAMEQNDPRKIFTFDEPRKTLVRSQGTITSFFVKSSTHEVADEMLKTLKVRRARQTFMFDYAFEDSGKHASMRKIHSMSSKTRSSASVADNSISDLKK